MHVHPRSISAVAVTCPNSNVTLCRSSNDNYVPDLTFTIPPIITSLTRSVSLLVLNKIGPHAPYVPIPSCPFHGTSAPRCCRKGRNCRAPCCPRESACPPDSASAIKAYESCCALRLFYALPGKDQESKSARKKGEFITDH